MEWLTDPVWVEARGWVIAVGGLIALFFAARTYVLNSREKREAQARLVFAQVSIEPMNAGSSIWTPAPRAKTGSKGHPATWRLRGDGYEWTFVEDGKVVKVEVVNASEELVGPVIIDAMTDDHLFTRDIDVIGPKGREGVWFIVSDRALYAHTYLHYRDGSGRWWLRTGTNPIRRRRVAPDLRLSRRLIKWIFYAVRGRGTRRRAGRAASRSASG